MSLQLLSDAVDAYGADCKFHTSSEYLRTTICSNINKWRSNGCKLADDSDTKDVDVIKMLLSKRPDFDNVHKLDSSHVAIVEHIKKLHDSRPVAEHDAQFPDISTIDKISHAQVELTALIYNQQTYNNYVDVLDVTPYQQAYMSNIAQGQHTNFAHNLVDAKILTFPLQLKIKSLGKLVHMLLNV